MRGALGHLSYANVVSTLCLCLVLGGGGAWAATHLTRNSVGTKQLKEGAVTLPKIDADAQAALKGQKGDLGPQGDPGPQGNPGTPGGEGPPGKDATSLFAYIYDEGPATSATVQWGEGVTGVTDPGTAGSPYQVSFGANLAHCAISVTSGQGAPSGPAPTRGTLAAEANVTSSEGGSTVEVRFWSGASVVDSSFFIVAFC